MKKQKGISQIAVMIVMLVLAIALPITTNLVKKSQENRSKAATFDCTIFNKETCLQNKEECWFNGGNCYNLIENGFECIHDSIIGFPGSCKSGIQKDMYCVGSKNDCVDRDANRVIVSGEISCWDWAVQICEYGSFKSLSGDKWGESSCDDNSLLEGGTCSGNKTGSCTYTKSTPPPASTCSSDCKGCNQLECSYQTGCTWSWNNYSCVKNSGDQPPITNPTGSDQGCINKGGTCKTISNDTCGSGYTTYIDGGLCTTIPDHSYQCCVPSTNPNPQPVISSTCDSQTGAACINSYSGVTNGLTCTGSSGGTNGGTINTSFTCSTIGKVCCVPKSTTDTPVINTPVTDITYDFTNAVCVDSSDTCRANYGTVISGTTKCTNTSNPIYCIVDTCKKNEGGTCRDLTSSNNVCPNGEHVGNGLCPILGNYCCNPASDPTEGANTYACVQEGGICYDLGLSQNVCPNGGTASTTSGCLNTKGKNYQCCVKSTSTPTTPVDSCTGLLGMQKCIGDNKYVNCQIDTNNYLGNPTYNQTIWWTISPQSCPTGQVCTSGNIAGFVCGAPTPVTPVTPTSVCISGNQKCTATNKYFTCNSGQWSTSTTNCPSGQICTNDAIGTNVCRATDYTAPSLNLFFAVSGVKAVNPCFGDLSFKVNVAKDGQDGMTGNVTATVVANKFNSLGDQVFKISNFALDNTYALTDKIKVFVSGKKTLATLYGKNNQVGGFGALNSSQILVSSLSNGAILDFSGYPVLNGDVGQVGQLGVQDGVVNAADFGHMKNQWGKTCSDGQNLEADLNGDCRVDTFDLQILKNANAEQYAQKTF
ncbi:MAG TPA: dockerin type I domain-containing protein [Candidatus Woesebacteria bacterium]|nr:dockerin type I domain-containing protein [Candidatus Woesebacteria bacterium]